MLNSDEYAHCVCPEGTFDSWFGPDRNTTGVTKQPRNVFCWEKDYRPTDSAACTDETSVTEPTLLADESTDRCLPCPSCVTCTNGAALPKLGYHKLDLSGREVGEFGNTLDSHHFLCPIEDACLAGGACTEGNAGLLCASCSESATINGNETVEFLRGKMGRGRK